MNLLREEDSVDSYGCPSLLSPGVGYGVGKNCFLFLCALELGLLDKASFHSQLCYLVTIGTWEGLNF